MSRFLLILVAAAAALLEVVGAFLPPQSTDRLLLRMALSVAMPLGFTWGLLAATRRKQRFLQTGSALLGVGVLVEIFLYPLSSLMHAVGADRLASVPLGLLMLAGLVWYMLACANIWRVSLDTGLAVGVAISVGYILLSIVLEQLAVPQT